MAVQIKNSLFKGVNWDLDQLRIPADVAVWIKDHTIGVNRNPGTPAIQGSNEGVITPSEGNTLLNTVLHAGTNYCIGFYSSEQTNEGYFCVYNSTGYHSVWVISGDTGATTKVFQDNPADPILNFQLDPEHYFSEGRITVWLHSVVDSATGLPGNYVFIILTDNFNNQLFIERDAAIATSSYTTSYFTASAAFYNRLELITLGVPTPLNTIGINTPVAYVPVPSDLTKQNLIVRKGYQIRTKNVDIFGRESEHGIISDVETPITGGGCISASNGLPRCFMVNFDAGNPLVDKIVIEAREWVGDDRAGALWKGWTEYETINKYQNTPGTAWYARSYNSLFTTAGSGVTFNASTNIISYTFCADKNSIPIDPTETERTEPGVPRKSMGLASLDKSLLLVNNERGFQPIPPAMVDKVVFSAQVPATAPCPAAPLRVLTVYASIYDIFNDESSIMRSTPDGVVWGGNRTPTDDCSNVLSAQSKGQKFGDQVNPGFIMYIIGTPYKCIGVQGDIDVSTGIFTPVGYGSGLSFPHAKIIQFQVPDLPACKGLAAIASHNATTETSDYQNTSTYVAGIVALAELTIANGRKGYSSNPLKEIAFDCSAGDVTYNQPTDPMFVILDAAAGQCIVDGYLYEKAGEDVPIEMLPLLIGGVSGGGTTVDTYGSFLTDRNGFYFAFNGHTTAHIQVWADICDGAGAIARNVYNIGGTPFPLIIGGNGVKHGDGSGTPPGSCVGIHGNWRNRLYLMPSTMTFPASARIVTTQKIFLCDDHSIGVPGVPVIMTKGGLGITNTSGVVTIIHHNRYNYQTVFGSAVLPYLGVFVPDYSTFPLNQDDLIIGQKGGCEWTNCGGCTYSMGDVTLSYISCTGSPRTFTAPDLFVRIAGGTSGLQSGGTYPVAFWCHDVIGRHTAPQVRQGMNGFVNVPNLNDVGYQMFALCTLKMAIGVGFAVDSVFTRMSALVGANVVYIDYISWSADWVQPIDNTGQTNPTNPTAIRIYYGSLNEYNKQYNFKTNTGWQPITSGAPDQSPVEGDIIQFIMNGDGNWIDSVVSAPITYDKNGLFFTLDYLPELAGLMNGCLFRIIRPAKNQSGENVPYYEQCLTIPLTNGVPSSNISPSGWISGHSYVPGDTVSSVGINYINILATSGTTAPASDPTHWTAVIAVYTLPYFDSYLNQRQIPVPILKGQPGAIAPGATPVLPIQYTSTDQDATLDTQGYSTNNVNNNNGVVIFDARNAATSFPFFFEGPSPADTWGSHLRNWGRVGFVNPYEQQRRLPTEAAVSATATERSNLNGLSYFESKNVQEFDRNTYGGITAVIVEQGQVIVICNNDWFITYYNQSTIHLNANGQINNQNSGPIFMAPQTKVGQNYGCIPFFINTIRRYEGIIWWLDQKYRFIRFEKGNAIDVAEKMGFSGYLMNKINTVNQLNMSPVSYGLNYPITGIDPKTKEIYLTWWHLPAGSGLLPPTYINQEDDINLLVNETIRIDLETGSLLGSAAFTPEYFGMVPGYTYQKQFFTFNAGQPYTHHQGNFVSPVAYANYYGTQCRPRITAIFNMAPEKEKRFLWIELYVRQTISSPPASPPILNTALFEADVIVTEKGQESRLVTARWKVVDGYQTAEFLCDLNTPPDPNIPVPTGPHAILDGNPLIGRWISVSIVPQSEWQGSYYELSAMAVYVSGIAPSDGNSK